MKINLTSVFVDDQEKALRFYTEILGFLTKIDVPMAGARWITVASTEAPDGTQLLLEPNDHPAAQAYQKAIHADGIPATSFGAENVQAEYERLSRLGVKFTATPTEASWGTYAIFDDTCGNLIEIHQG